MRKIWSLKKKVSVRKKKTFWLWYHYRNWSLVLVPDTKIWFRSHTSKIFLTKNSWIQLLFWAEFLNNSAFTFKILTRDVQNHQFESADGNNIFGVFNFFVESRILTGKLVLEFKILDRVLFWSMQSHLKSSWVQLISNDFWNYK